ncbi:MAG: hypothetical protein IPM54_32325 [Polyangiaceae bacterium]|nr:hypothetical protein [Polyangiaceae bacterium]
MRLIVSPTLLAISCVALFTAGCSPTVDSSPLATGGAGGEGGAGGAGGEAGQGGGGGPSCIPEAEQCDGMDNDCDEQVDEDCPCIDGQTQDCYSGPMNTSGVGACIGGQQTCNLAGEWGPCMGEVLPGTETCNNVDDDCNGLVDDMGTTSCGVGACGATVLVCENGQMNSCVPGNPSPELCDGLDNDCDQLVDETYPGKGSACDTGVPGACAAGKTDCLMGAPMCVQDVMPTTEICNGVDDDCNGMADDNIAGTGTACGTGLAGVCSQGTYSCKFNVIDCHPDIPASPEMCNGLDDDCDGVTDEDDPQGGAVCMTGMPGICATGIEHCNGGAIACVPDSLGNPELCNGLDDNCDGMVDENNPGGNAACGCGGTTQCQSGALNCIGGPTTYFIEDFADNEAGWTLDTEWQIAPAVSGCSGYDPGTDTTPTSDNGIAGVAIGACAATSSTHPYYYLTSPVINTANAPAVFLQFRRWLTSDYTPYMKNVIEVYNGSSWVVVWETFGSPGVTDTSWQTPVYDITAHKNANMRVRWGFNVGSTGAFSRGQWNIDDVLVASAACP